MALGNLKSYIIILEESELGKSIGKQAIEAAERFGINLEVHPAVLGYNSKPKFEEYGITKFLNRTILQHPGHQGCFLSHFELWQKCVDLNEPIIILEHDGIFLRELPDDVLDNFEDILRLDNFEAWKPEYEQKVNNSLTEPVNYWSRPTECSWHSSGDYYVGAYGYIIKPHAAQKLIDHAIQNGAVCTEAHIGTKIVDIKSTTATIVRLHEMYVDKGVEFSTTFNLELAVNGQNKMLNAEYISPRMYSKRGINS